ncbi:MAG TPA: tRNA (adenosine(37)-N6)-threonylcarbamoyltransferase complex transferase subunit TsaD [Candidatus Omnitrophota bacterium]|nr:tRNA (adenosine(37)-N6)-threonylcarbamoyltransferase complex transferase subunit TsaD [Candidatus Omnitrophota bacterium]
MIILGIETSCDETAASVVANGRDILSHVVSSSLVHHKKYGGIIPEIASRKQLESIHTVVDEALKTARKKISQLDGVAVTASPGLIGSLLVGISFAQGLAYSHNIPLVKVDHIMAHIYANFLVFQRTSGRPQTPELPAVGLIVSGGHTNLFFIKNFRSIELIGQTRDDAAGETYDKVSRILGLGYPGGPAIDRLAQQGKNTEFTFPCAQLPGSYDFSFSGIKTAIYYLAHHHKDHHNKLPVKKIAYSFQKSVVDVLVKKTIDACQRKKARTILVGGGVAANSELRRRLLQAGQDQGIKVFFPDLRLCIDNASMIAGLGFHIIQQQTI